MFKNLFIILLYFITTIGLTNAEELPKEAESGQEAEVRANFQNEKSSIKKFDVIELEGKNQKQFALVVSSNKYNVNSKTIIVAPVTLLKKNFKISDGKNTIIVKSLGKEYIIYIDKLRTIPKKKAIKSSISINERAKTQAQKTLNTILN